MGKALLLAKTCCQSPAFQEKGSFKQMYLVCLCATSEQDQLMDEVSAATQLRVLHALVYDFLVKSEERALPSVTCA